MITHVFIVLIIMLTFDIYNRTVSFKVGRWLTPFHYTNGSIQDLNMIQVLVSLGFSVHRLTLPVVGYMMYSRGNIMLIGL